jgi:hypothetical protein
MTTILFKEEDIEFSDSEGNVKKLSQQRNTKLSHQRHSSNNDDDDNDKRHSASSRPSTVVADWFDDSDDDHEQPIWNTIASLCASSPSASSSTSSSGDPVVFGWFILCQPEFWLDEFEKNKGNSRPFDCFPWWPKFEKKSSSSKQLRELMKRVEKDLKDEASLCVEFVRSVQNETTTLAIESSGITLSLNDFHSFAIFYIDLKVRCIV